MERTIFFENPPAFGCFHNFYGSPDRICTHPASLTCLLIKLVECVDLIPFLAGTKQLPVSEEENSAQIWNITKRFNLRVCLFQKMKQTGEQRFRGNGLALLYVHRNL